jgi:hypothetical protein
MNAQPNPVHLAVRGLCPAPSEADRVRWDLEAQLRQSRAECQRLAARLDKIVPSPFLIDVEVEPAITNRAPEDCREVVYAEREADEAVVDDAIAWLVEKHADELSRKVAKLQKVADLQAAR